MTESLLKKKKLEEGSVENLLKMLLFPPQETAVSEDSFSDRQEAIVEKGLTKSVGQVGQFLTGEISSPELAGDILGNAASYYLETGGNAIISGIKSVAEKSPPELNDAVVAGYDTFINLIPAPIKIALSEKGANIVESGGDAIEFYKELEEENPRTMQQVENVANVLFAAWPASKGNPIAKPTLVSKTGGKLIKEAKKLGTSQRRDKITELIRPKTFANTKEGAKESLRTVDEGILRSKKIIANAEEKRITKSVSKVPDINPLDNFTRNQNRIIAHKDELIRRLDEGLKGLPPTTKNLIDETSSAIDDAVKAMFDKKVFLKESKKEVAEIVVAAKKVLANTDNSAHGIWKARIALDDLVKEAKGSFPEKAGVFDSANKTIRQAMNKIVVKNSKGVKTQQLLDNSSNLFKAIAAIAPKAKGEATNAIMRQVHNLTEVLGARSKVLGLAAVGLGTTVLAASQVVSGPIGAGIATFMAAKGIHSAWKTPAFKKGLGVLLKATDEGMRVATSSKMRKQLRIDRAAILELMRNIELDGNQEAAPQQKKRASST